MSSKNFLIGHRIAFGFCVPLIALIAIGAISIRNLDSMQREANWVSHTLEVMNELRSFTDAVSRIESAGRGYVLIGDASLKSELDVQSTASAASLQRIRNTTGDNPEQQARLDKLSVAINRRADLARDLITLRDNGEYRTSPRINQIVLDGQTLTETIRTLAAEMIREEAALLALRRAASAEATALTRKTVTYGSVSAFFIVIAAGVMLTRNITRPLVGLRNSATRIGEGDYAHRADVLTEDEVGHLGRVFNAMAAQVQMRQAVQADQDWLKSGLARFNTLFQQQRDFARVGQAVLTELAALVKAPSSVLYRVVDGASGEQLELCASHAAESPPQQLTVNQGLAGQCLAGKKRILLTDTPPGYLRIGSALGGAQPAIVLVEPVLFEGRLKAVLELASFQPFTPLQQELVTQLAASLGIVLQTIEAMLSTEQLLARSQAMTVQLESQQRILAGKNAELEEQADRLRKSEILLQEQQVELTQTNEELEQSNEEMEQSNEELEEKSNLLVHQKHELEISNKAMEQARAELQEQARQLAITSKYKSDFLATMSHELRTPLNSLLILSRLLVENRDANLTPKQVQFARTIESSGSDLLEMINQILDLAKIESGTVELQLDEITPEDLQRSVDLQFRHIAEQKKLEFSVTLAPGLPPTLRTDAGRLHQVIKNLLANAFKFTEHGAVAVDVRTVTTGWKRKSTTLEQAPGVVAISVTDTGIGIPKEKQMIIFESFQQADAGTARRFGGTGLGLSISREIALLLGGVLQLESEPGKGSTFTLFLPVTVDADAARASAAADRKVARTTVPLEVKPAPSAAAPEADENWDESTLDDDRDQLAPDDRVILIIEDDDRFARILVDFAREKKFKAIVARSARKGLAMAERYLPVAITLDLRLVDDDGWVVLDRLKHNERTRHIPVHVISVEPARGRGLRLGAVSYLQKPVTQEAINEILQQTVDFIERPVKNLLVVEDDAVQRDTIRELIGNGDVHTTAVGNAAEALKQLSEHRYDCIVMDLMLPDKSGVELIREINRLLGLQAPPVIVYTGKELSPHEETELRSLSESIIVKDARSPERLLDETALFLHRVQSRLPESKRRMLEQVRKQDAVLTGRRVLVVDDDVRNIFALTAALEAYGMDVKFAESGKAALETLQADPTCDIVLMDVMMPEMDGYEAIRRLRADSRFAQLPIISVTAKAMKGDRERCIEAGASDYITKPVDTDKLISLLRVWLYR